MSILVSDGKQASCQLLTIRVAPAGSARQDRVRGQHALYAHASAMPCILLQSIPLRNLARAVNDVVAGIGEDLMVLLVLPWALGLYCRLKNREATLERVLIAAILIVNLGLMLGRHMRFGPGSERRYSLAMIALTIFYLPTGLDLLTRGLDRVRPFRIASTSDRSASRSRWFYLFIAVAVVFCTPKLLFTPLRAEKAGLRATGEWLRQNSEADAVIAEPDRRISFYAGRQGLPYAFHPNARQADYVVEIAHGDPAPTLDGWTRVYSTALGSRDDRMVIVYRVNQTKE